MIASNIPVAALRRHPANAREKREYSKSEVADLATSIRAHGLVQPLVVTKDGDNYTILAGHRRHAALVSLGIKEAPCVVLGGDEQASLAVLLGENASHRAVDPLLEASAVAKLVLGFADAKHPYDRAAAVVGKSTSWVRGRMRLTALSEAWRAAHADPENPIHEWPVGHLELVAALPEPVQNEVLEEWTAFVEGVPLADELRTSLSRSTCDLAKVPWDRDAVGIVENAPACSACPFRASAQGVLFSDDSKGDRCLNAPCFEAKRRATVATLVAQAHAKHGAALRVESTYGLEDVPFPDGVRIHKEFDLVPRPKGKGGFPVLRLRTLEVVYMAEARAAASSSSRDEAPAKPAGPKSLAERRTELEKRRRIRAIELLRGSLLGTKVDLGTERHPEVVTPPGPQVPDLPSLVGLVLTYGTGFPVGGEERIPGRPDTASLATALETASGTTPAAADAARAALWARVREPIARALRIVGTVRSEYVADLAAQAETVAGLCGLDWQGEFLRPAVESIPEPRAWTTRRAS